MTSRRSVPTDQVALRAATRTAAGDARAALVVADLAQEHLAAVSMSEILLALQAIAAIDLTVARVIEPHLDALLIRAEAGLGPLAGRYGVFAAEAPGKRLDARCDDGVWRLDGVKPWCSLAGLLDRALITAHTTGGRRLFDLDLRQPGVQVRDPSGAGWVARGLSTVVTSDLECAGARAEPVGTDNWYLERPGFAWGGIRVAACWTGAARALADALHAALAARDVPDPLHLAGLGAADVSCWPAEQALAHAGAVIDAGQACGRSAALLAARTRALAAGAAESVLREVGHALGPAPLAYDDEHARRVADLTLYVRQHHASRDLAALGELLLGDAAPER